MLSPSHLVLHFFSKKIPIVSSRRKCYANVVLSDHESDFRGDKYFFRFYRKKNDRDLRLPSAILMKPTREFSLYLPFASTRVLVFKICRRFVGVIYHIARILPRDESIGTEIVHRDRRFGYTTFYDSAACVRPRGSELIDVQ